VVPEDGIQGGIRWAMLRLGLAAATTKLCPDTNGTRACIL